MPRHAFVARRRVRARSHALHTGVCSIETKHLFFSGFMFHAGNIRGHRPSSTPAPTASRRAPTGDERQPEFFCSARSLFGAAQPRLRETAQPRRRCRRSSASVRNVIDASCGRRRARKRCDRRARSLRSHRRHPTMVGRDDDRRTACRTPCILQPASGNEEAARVSVDGFRVRQGSARCRGAISDRRLRAVRRSRPGRAVR